MYLDKHGLIVQKNGDNSLTTNEEALYFIYLYLVNYSPVVHMQMNKEFDRVIPLLPSKATTSMIIALGFWNKYEVLKHLFKFKDIGIFIRAFKLWYLWPILYLSDLSLIRTPSIDRTLTLLQATKTYPTPISWIMRKIFSRGNIQQLWDDIYSKPGMNDFNGMYRPIIRRYF